MKWLRKSLYWHFVDLVLVFVFTFLFFNFYVRAENSFVTPKPAEKSKIWKIWKVAIILGVVTTAEFLFALQFQNVERI